MLLCDIGNTSYHFLDGTKDYKEDCESFNPSLVKENVYYICVNQKVSELLETLSNWIDLAEYIDMKNYYETMGVDRIVAISGKSNVVIVDAGSAITVDVIRDDIFEGGFIFPGLSAMMETYKRVSPALDYKLNLNVDLEKLPKNSQDAISYGILKTLSCEVYSYGLEILLTGGDAENLIKVFPEAHIDNMLIFKGMKNIIEKNL